MHSWSLKSIWWKPQKSPSPKIREYVLKLTIFQVLMENWYPFFESFSVSILQKMFSKLIFGYGKLIMRIYFAQIVIHIKIDFDFFIPSRVRIDHSEGLRRLIQFLEKMHYPLFFYSSLHSTVRKWWQGKGIWCDDFC